MDYINEQRKEHRGCGKNEVSRNVLKLKPDALGGLSATATPDEVLNFQDMFNTWYHRFRKRRGFSVRRRTSVDLSWTLRTSSGVAVAERPPRASGFNSKTFLIVQIHYFWNRFIREEIDIGMYLLLTGEWL